MTQGICPQCGTLSPGKFCPVCGGEIPRQPICPGCGSLLRPQAAFCSDCGMQVGAPPQAEAIPSAPPPQEAPPPQAAAKRRPPPPPPPMWSADSQRAPPAPRQSAPSTTRENTPPSSKRKKKKPVLAAVILLLAVAVGGTAYVLTQRQPVSGSGNTLDVLQSGAVAEQAPPENLPVGASFELTGGSGADSFNRSMLGLCVTAGDTWYTSVNGAVQNADGTVLYNQPLYFMNEADGALYGVTAKGKIVRVDRDGAEQSLRGVGNPSMLIVRENAMYFIDSGLYRMNLSSGEETLLTEHLRGECLDLVEDYLYYIAGDDRLVRMPVEGGEPEALTTVAVSRFCIDNGVVYFTLLGDSALWKLTGDGSYELASTAMAGVALPRFAVTDGEIYFTGASKPVYQCALEGGEIVVASSGSSGVFYLVEDGVLSLSRAPEIPEAMLADQ